MDLMRQVVKEANKAVFLGSMLANAFVLRCVRGGISLPKLNLDFFDLCIRRVSSSCKQPTRDKSIEMGIEPVYRALWGARENLVKTEKFGNIIRYEATQLATAADNYNTIAVYDHMATYIQAKHGLPRKGHGKFISGRVTHKNPLGYTYIPKTIGLSREEIDKIIIEETTLFDRALDNEELTQYRYMMMQAIERANTDELSYKSFTLIPERHMGTKFVPMDVTVLKKLWNRLSPCRKNMWKSDEERVRWEEWENFPKSHPNLSDWLDIPKRGPGWVYEGKQFRTNGFEFHFTFDKNKERIGPRAKKVKKSMLIMESDWDPGYNFENVNNKDISNPCNFAASDVGHHNIFTSVSPTGDTDINGVPFMEKRNYSKKRYVHEAKRRKVLERIKILQRHKGVRALEAQLSERSLKTTDFGDLREAILLRCEVYDAIYGHYHNRQLLKLKAEARIAEKRAIDRMLNWVTYGKKKPLGLGDCSKTNGFKGTSPGGPTKRIKRHAIKSGYEIISVDEFRTSKMSSCCRGFTMRPMRGFNKKGVFGDLHGVRICNKCGKTWDRDFSAAINIFDVFYNSIVLGGEHPPHLRRDCEPGLAVEGTWGRNWFKPDNARL